MPYCPRCHSEYREGVARCADCDLPLVAARQPETPAPVPADPSTEPVLLARLADAAEVQVICTALREADIPCITQRFGPISGELATVTDGFAPEDYTALRVPKGRLEEAEHLLAALRFAPMEWPEGLDPED